jgi:hypothetical protein
MGQRLEPGGLRCGVVPSAVRRGRLAVFVIREMDRAFRQGWTGRSTAGRDDRIGVRGRYCRVGARTAHLVVMI